MKKLDFISFSILFFFIFSCKKVENRSCFKKEGKIESRLVIVENFSKLFLKENLDYVLVQDSLNKVVISGGENLINLVDAKVEDNTLTLQNNNKCNFLRYNAEKIKVYIHFTSLNTIHFEGTDSLRCEDVLNVSWLNLIIRDGGGSVNLDINADHVYSTITNGYGDFKLSGTANYSSIFLQSNGYCDTYNLSVKDSVSVKTYSPSRCKVKANQAKLNVEIAGKGDVWYKGYPSFINLIKSGTGELIPKN
mgnify:CR=1 FL=1